MITRQFKLIQSVLLFILLTGVSSIGFPANLCSDHLEVDAATARLVLNSFNTSRGLSHYVERFTPTGSSFRNTLLDLPSGSIWLDSGTGQARALVEGLNSYPNIGQGIGIGYQRPDNFIHPSELGNRFSYLDGELIENMAKSGRLNHLMGKVNLITDLYGSLSYTKEFAEVLQVLVDLLAKDGKIFFHLTRTKNSVIATHEAGSSLLRWLESIPGLEVTSLTHPATSKFENRSSFETILIRKTTEDVKVPTDLILKTYEDGTPPKRRHLWDRKGK